MRRPLLNKKAIRHLQVRREIDDRVLGIAALENAQFDNVIDLGRVPEMFDPNAIEHAVSAARNAEIGSPGQPRLVGSAVPPNAFARPTEALHQTNASRLEKLVIGISISALGEHFPRP